MGQHIAVELRGALRIRTVQLPASDIVRRSRAAYQRVLTLRAPITVVTIGSAAVNICILGGRDARQRHILRAAQRQRAVVGDGSAEGSPGQLQCAIIRKVRKGGIDRGILQRQLVGIRGHRSTTHACTAHRGISRGAHRAGQHQLAVTRDIARDGRTAQRQRTRAQGIDGVAARAHSAHRGIRRGVHRAGQHQFIVTRDIARDGRTAQRQRTRAQGIDGVAARAHSAHRGISRGVDRTGQHQLAVTRDIARDGRTAQRQRTRAQGIDGVAARAHSAHRGIRRGVHRAGQHQFIVTRDIARDGRTAQRQSPGARGIHRQGTGACAAHRRRRRGDRRTGQHQLAVARDIARDGSVRQRHRSGAVSCHRSTTYARTAHAPAIRMGSHQRATGDGGDDSRSYAGCRADGQCTALHIEGIGTTLRGIRCRYTGGRDAPGRLLIHRQMSGITSGSVSEPNTTAYSQFTTIYQHLGCALQGQRTGHLQTSV